MDSYPNSPSVVADFPRRSAVDAWPTDALRGGHFPQGTRDQIGGGNERSWHTGNVQPFVFFLIIPILLIYYYHVIKILNANHGEALDKLGL